MMFFRRKLIEAQVAFFLPRQPELQRHDDGHEHHWDRREELPRGYCVQCALCLGWQMVITEPMPDGTLPEPFLLPQENIDRALALFRTEKEIRALPER